MAYGNKKSSTKNAIPQRKAMAMGMKPKQGQTSSKKKSAKKKY